MIKVSIIIPVYNVEKYISECLDSVINQSLKDIEIICIDDCSTDNSYNILLEYSKKDNRIKVLKNEENKSAGPTRNIGMKIAQGEYISFIDSDDYISLNYLEDLYNTAKKYDSDVVNTLNMCIDVKGKIFDAWFNINSFLSKNELNKSKEYESNTNNNLINICIRNKYLITFNPVNKLYRRNFLFDRELFFMDNKFVAEDADFNIRVILNSPKLSYNNKPAYYYRKRLNSLMSNVNNNIESQIKAIEHMYNTINYCKEKFPEQLECLYSKIWMAPLHIFMKLSYLDKERFFDYFKKLAQSIYIDEKYYDYETKHNYFEYITIINSESYKQYLLYKQFFNLHSSNQYHILKLEKKIDNINNNKLFGIIKSDDYFIIVFFGIRLSIKKKRKIYNDISNGESDTNND